MSDIFDMHASEANEKSVIAQQEQMRDILKNIDKCCKSGLYTLLIGLIDLNPMNKDRLEELGYRLDFTKKGLFISW